MLCVCVCGGGGGGETRVAVRRRDPATGRMAMGVLGGGGGGRGGEEGRTRNFHQHRAELCESFMRQKRECQTIVFLDLMAKLQPSPKDFCVAGRHVCGDLYGGRPWFSCFRNAGSGAL